MDGAAGRPPGFVLTIQHMPPPLYDCFRNVPKRGRVKTARYKTWLRAVGWDVLQQRVEPVRGPVRADIRLQPLKRRSDLDNRLKATLDLLTNHRLIDDDSAIHDLRIRWDATVTGARIEVRPI